MFGDIVESRDLPTGYPQNWYVRQIISKVPNYGSYGSFRNLVLLLFCVANVLCMKLLHSQVLLVV